MNDEEGERRSMISELKTIRVNEVELAYLEAGQGPLVLCVHGFPDTPHGFEHLLGRLSESGFHAVAPFLRGYPPSAAPADGDYSVLGLAEDVVSLIDAFGGGQAVLIGHDWGAAAVLAAANLAPSRVKCLVTAAIPHPRAIRPTLKLLFNGRHFLFLQLPLVARWIRMRDLRYLETLYRRWSPGWDLEPADLAAMRESLGAPGGLEAAIAYYRAAVSRGLGKRARESRRLLRLRTSAPTLAIGGDRDVIDVSTLEKARGAFTGEYEVAVIKGAGHFAHREAPEVFADHVLSFLEAR